MWLYQNEKLTKDGQSLCVSPELKLVEGESYREGVDFKIIGDTGILSIGAKYDSRIAIPTRTAEGVLKAAYERNFNTQKYEKSALKHTYGSVVLAAMEEYKSAPDPTDKTEGEDELWKEAGKILYESWTIHEVIEKLKSQFSITRKDKKK